jgi:hypothetical protein
MGWMFIFKSVGLRTSLEVMETRKKSLVSGRDCNPGYSSAWHCHDTNYATPAACRDKIYKKFKIV